MFLPSAALLISFPLLVSALSPPLNYTECEEIKYRPGAEYEMEACTRYEEKMTTHTMKYNACLTPLRTRIPIGDRVVENGIEYSCVKFRSRANLEKKEIKNVFRSKRQTILCDGQYKNGERFHAGNFINQCTVTGNCWTIAPVGCLTPDRKEIAAGSSAAEKGLLFKCMINGRGLETSNLPTGTQMLARRKFVENLLCKGQYKNGERFESGNFIAECKSTPNSYYINFVACLTPMKKEIAVGESATEEGFEYKCTKTDKGTMVQALPIR